jgi:hypothetical protein
MQFAWGPRNFLLKLFHLQFKILHFDVLLLNTPPAPKTQMMVPPKLAKVGDDGGGLRLLYGIPKGSYFYHTLALENIPLG